MRPARPGPTDITDGNGSNVIVGGAGNDTITAGNGSSIIYGGAGNDTINVGNGSSVIMAGAGSDTINSGGGSDLAIYALSDHYKIMNGALQTIAGDVDVYKGGGGNDTICIVVTADEYALIKSQLTAYASWSAANQGSNATYSFNFAAGTSGAGISTVGGGLSLNSWESLQVQVVNTGTVNLAPSATSATGSLNISTCSTTRSALARFNLPTRTRSLGLTAGTGQIATSLDPSLTVAQYLHGTATLPTSYTVAGTDGTLTVFADGSYSYSVTSHTAATDTFTLTTLDQNGFVTSTTLTFGVPVAANHAVSAPTDTDSTGGTGSGVVNENAANGSTVGITAHATDTDPGDTVSYSIVNSYGAGNVRNGLFTVDSSGVVKVADSAHLDYEAIGSSVNVTVRATSSDGTHCCIRSSPVAVTNVNDNPVVGPTDTDGADRDSVARKRGERHGGWDHGPRPHPCGPGRDHQLHAPQR